jgi:hydroxyacylglutathione hydrolase
MLLIETRAVAPFWKNGFVVTCGRTREAILIDPGDEVGDLLKYIADQALAVRHILLTHAHVDHISGVAAARRALGVSVYLHRDDQFLYDRAVTQGAVFGLRVEAPPPVDEYYSPGQVIAFGEYEVRPHHTPGHSPGGVCLQVRAVPEGRQPADDADDLFVGDTLFASSIGRTDLPGGDYATLIATIRSVLFPFSDAARVHPGHGPSTTIGQERVGNPFLQD